MREDLLNHFSILGEVWIQLVKEVGDMFQFGGVFWVNSFSVLKNPWLYPEVIQIDTTAISNSENLPLAFIVGVDGENHSNNWMYGILPNQRRLTFIWVMMTVIPLFLGPVVCSAIHCIVSDGDRQLCDSISFAIRERMYGGGNCVHLLCYWHTINLYLLENARGISGEHLTEIKHRLKSMATDCETMDDFSLKWNSLEKYVDSCGPGCIPSSLSDALLTIHSKADKWSCAYYPHLRNFGEITSGRSEAENMHHKKDPTIHAQSKMHQNVAAISKRMENRETNEVIHLNNSNKRPLLTDLTEYPNLSDPEQLLWIRESLTHHAQHLLFQQLSFSYNYSATITSSTSIQVFYSSSTSSKSAPHRVRNVTYSSPSKIIVCSCSFMWEFALPCRHILCALRTLNILLQAHHIHLRWHKSWASGKFLPLLPPLLHGWVSWHPF